MTVPMPDAFTATAWKLLAGQPTDTDIRRAISTAYYAMFHHACSHFSQIVLQEAPGTFTRARLQAYRYLDHGLAKQRCLEATTLDRSFPSGIVQNANAFVHLQQKRNDVDYDPSKLFTASDAIALSRTLTSFHDAIRSRANRGTARVHYFHRPATQEPLEETHHGP